MKTRNLKFGYLIKLMLVVSYMNAQDIHFSQANFSTANINPAYACLNFSQNAVILYRSQWQSIGFPYKTMYASFDSKLTRPKYRSKGYLAGGLSFFSDQAGEVKVSNNNVGLSLAYFIKLSKYSTLGAAILTRYNQRSINFDAARWGTQYNGLQFDAALNSSESANNNSISFVDFGGGIIYGFKKTEKYSRGTEQFWFNSGLAVYHINKSKYGLMFKENDRLYQRYIFFANSVIGFSSSYVYLAPSIMYQIQGPSSELLAGSYVKIQISEKSTFTNARQNAAISPGIFYRNKDAIIFKFLFEFGNYSIGFAYDYNVSRFNLATRSRGGFEIMLRYVNPSPFSGRINRARI